jgi:predicted O-linked N-acetylglucosamine transferase (SPINDLY family)
MYQEPPAERPDVAPAPCIANGVVTFGSFNRSIKLTAAVLDTWARIVAQVPGSRMVLKYAGLDDADSVARIRAAFAARGVGPERVDVLGKSSRYEHLAAYERIDVQLDPYPHGGGVTTYEGLLMGVPCVTILGNRLSGRVSASFLTAIGLTDLVARSLDEYVEIATRLAGDRDRLVRERSTLRERLLASPISDCDQYTRAAEAAYRTLWGRWCAKQTGR